MTLNGGFHTSLPPTEILRTPMSGGTGSREREASVTPATSEYSPVTLLSRPPKKPSSSLALTLSSSSPLALSLSPRFFSLLSHCLLKLSTFSIHALYLSFCFFAFPSHVSSAPPCSSLALSCAPPSCSATSARSPLDSCAASLAARFCVSSTGCGGRLEKGGDSPRRLAWYSANVAWKRGGGSGMGLPAAERSLAAMGGREGEGGGEEERWEA
jgi:hypothetical protein